MIVENITSHDYRHAGVRKRRIQVFSVSNLCRYLIQYPYLPIPVIRHRITKHLHKNRLREAVELGQGFAALGSEGIGLVEDGGDAALFGEWG